MSLRLDSKLRIRLMTSALMSLGFIYCSNDIHAHASEQPNTYDKGYQAGYEAAKQELSKKGYDGGYKTAKKANLSEAYAAGYNAGKTDSNEENVSKLEPAAGGDDRYNYAQDTNSRDLKTLVSQSPERQTGKKEGTHNNSVDPLVSAFTKGRAYLDARYRFEYVDQDGFSKEAKASTLRTRVGYETGEVHNLKGTIEFEDITVVGAERYNSTTNSKTSFPTVADPEETELNQAFLTYTGVNDSEIKLGRQRIVLDNARFVGDVGWRQNNQTFDAATITNNSVEDTQLFYGYSSNVNRIFGNDHPTGDFNGDIHLLNGKYTGLPAGNITLYWYGLDIDNSVTSSSSTYGARFNGKKKIKDGVKFLYDAELARQSDYGDNPTNYDATYYRIEPGIKFKGIKVKAGLEVLGSDNGIASFQTPLATGHKFNGWADKFLTTPTGGLEDLYGLVGYKIKGVNEIIDGTKILAVYHDFSAEEGSADYGTEWDLKIAKKFLEHYTVAFKYENYDADTFSKDTEKFALLFGIQLSQ